MPRKLYSTRPDHLDYRDFICFMLAEQDKTTDVAIDYWFRVVDLDANGLLAGWELNTFYEE